ncbi:MAG: hypothetical protein NTU89_01150 [Candidatus Dependentiae bacterium]|nr:hypothetical protein [Candidatus Dependentiae bacterium]
MTLTVKALALSIFFLSAPVSAMQRLDNIISKSDLSRLCTRNIDNADWKLSEVESLAWVIKSIEKNNNDYSHFNESWYKLRHELKAIRRHYKL